MNRSRILSLLLALCLLAGMISPASATVQNAPVENVTTAGPVNTQVPTGNALQESAQLMAEYFPARAQQALNVTATEIDRPTDSALLSQSAEKLEFTHDPDEIVRAIVLLEDDCLLDMGYWAAYQGYDGESALKEIDKATGKVLSSVAVEYNSQLAALFKPYEEEADRIPDDAALTGIALTQSSVSLRRGASTALRCLPAPYYASLSGLSWTSADESIASVDQNGVVTAQKAGTVRITARWRPPVRFASSTRRARSMSMIMAPTTAQATPGSASISMPPQMPEVFPAR